MPEILFDSQKLTVQFKSFKNPLKLKTRQVAISFKPRIKMKMDQLRL